MGAAGYLLLLTGGCADLMRDAERIAGVLTLSARKRTRALVEEAFPDLMHLRLRNAVPAFAGRL
jgi:hypothetical protein